MQTHADQKTFFDAHWPGLLAAFEEGGAPAVSRLVASYSDSGERRLLWLLGWRAFRKEPWSGKSADGLVELAEAAVDEMLRQAAGSTDAERRARLQDLAGGLACELATLLADCWPEDGLCRERRHFEQGLVLARRSLRWREEAGRGPGALANAWWAQGIHQLGLGDPAAACESFERGFDLAAQAAADEHDFLLVLLGGYVGLARWVGGDDEGHARFRAALSAFARQLFDPEKKADARLGIDQLERAKARYGPGAVEP